MIRTLFTAIRRGCVLHPLFLSPPPQRQDILKSPSLARQSPCLASSSPCSGRIMKEANCRVPPTKISTQRFPETEENPYLYTLEKDNHINDMENSIVVNSDEHSKEKILYMIDMAKEFEAPPNRHLLDGRVVATLFSSRPPVHASVSKRLPTDWEHESSVSRIRKPPVRPKARR